MRIVLYKNGIFVKEGYNRKDISIAPEGLESELQYYYIDAIKPENPNSDRYYLSKLDSVLTEEPHPDYPHLLRAVEEYELKEFSQNVIIEKLNKSLGEHLDTNYPTWKRTKHLRELDTADEDRAYYIQSLFDWEDRCRTERDLREEEYINNNVFPTFDWEDIPE